MLLVVLFLTTYWTQLKHLLSKYWRVGFLADRTNGRAIGTVLRLSVVVCRLSVTLCIVAKRYVLQLILSMRHSPQYFVTIV